MLIPSEFIAQIMKSPENLSSCYDIRMSFMTIDNFKPQNFNLRSGI